MEFLTHSCRSWTRTDAFPPRGIRRLLGGDEDALAGGAAELAGDGEGGGQGSVVGVEALEGDQFELHVVGHGGLERVLSGSFGGLLVGGEEAAGEGYVSGYAAVGVELELCGAAGSRLCGSFKGVWRKLRSLSSKVTPPTFWCQGRAGRRGSRARRDRRRERDP